MNGCQNSERRRGRVEAASGRARQSRVKRRERPQESKGRSREREAQKHRASTLIIFFPSVKHFRLSGLPSFVSCVEARSLLFSSPTLGWPNEARRAKKTSPAKASGQRPFHSCSSQLLPGLPFSFFGHFLSSVVRLFSRLRIGKPGSTEQGNKGKLFLAGLWIAFL